jgi:hypothetical protein
VRRLPEPFRIELVAERVVERPPVAGAARVVLAVRADEEEWVPDAGACLGVEQVEAAQVLVRLELESTQSLAPFARVGHVRDEPLSAAAVGAAHEEHATAAGGLLLLAQVRLDLIGEAAAGNRVARPEPSVLDEEPAVDAACGGGQRLAVLARQVGAERSSLSHRPPGSRRK